MCGVGRIKYVKLTLRHENFCRCEKCVLVFRRRVENQCAKVMHIGQIEHNRWKIFWERYDYVGCISARRFARTEIVCGSHLNHVRTVLYCSLAVNERQSARQRKLNNVSVDTRQKEMIPVRTEAANTQWLCWEDDAWKRPRHGVSNLTT